jgi:hypothetical protein
MVVLKSRLSGYYFKDFGAWTPDPFKAKAFNNEWCARSFIHEQHVEDVQVTEPDILAPEFTLAA